MSKIKLYDTVKDKKGNRFKVTEVKADDGRLVATLRMLDKGGIQKKGRPRKVDMKTLEADYKRVDLPEVTVRKIDDLRKEEREMVKVFGKNGKGAQKENQSLTGLSDEDVKKALTASTFGGEKTEPLDEDDIIMKGMEEEIEKLKQANADLRRINEEWAGGKKENLDVLKAECISLKEENKKLHAKAKDGIQEVVDLKKTISKMQQEHEAEVADLKDRIMEAEAKTNAIRKNKDKILKKSIEYADAMDNDSVAFEAILDLARIAQSVSQSLYKVSERIEAEAEGRI